MASRRSRKGLRGGEGGRKDRQGHWPVYQRVSPHVPCLSVNTPTPARPPRAVSAIFPPHTSTPVQPLLYRQRPLLLRGEPLGPRRLRSRAPHQLQRALEVLVPQLHLAPLTPHLGQVVHVLEGGLQAGGGGGGGSSRGGKGAPHPDQEGGLRRCGGGGYLKGDCRKGGEGGQGSKTREHGAEQVPSSHTDCHSSNAAPLSPLLL